MQIDSLLSALIDLPSELYPVRFDPVIYFCSLQYSDALSARRELYLRSFSSPNDSDNFDPPRIQQDLLDWCGTEIPAYRGYHLFSEFSDFPFLSKNSIQHDGRSFINSSKQYTDHVLWRAHTFGTTSAPVPVFYSPAFYFEYLHLTIWKTCYDLLGPPGQSEVFCVSIDNNPEAGNFATLDPTVGGGLSVKIQIDETERSSFNLLFTAVAILRPRVVASRPSVFEAVVAYAQTYGRRHGFVVPDSIECVFSAGSFLTETSRSDVSSVFRAPVLNCYGLAEFGFVAGECQYQDGYHIDPTSAYLEFAESETEVPTHNHGEIVLSSTLNRAMPLIRYRTGDYASLDGAKCHCGRSTPKIRDIRGHGPFYFEFANGDRLHPSRLYAIQWMFPVSEFQVIQTSPSRLSVKICGTAGFSRPYLSDIERMIRGMAEGIEDVEIRQEEQLELRKTERFRSDLSSSMVGRDLWSNS